MYGNILQENNKVSAESEAHENNKIIAEAEAYENIDFEIDENNLYQIENISLDEKKWKTERHKRAFEIDLENTYEIESQNGMTCIHGKSK